MRNTQQMCSFCELSVYSTMLKAVGIKISSFFLAFKLSDQSLNFFFQYQAAKSNHRMNALFKRMDKNKDNLVDFPEFLRFIGRMLCHLLTFFI
uniref:EF-hand domain-containing protein n=1 Tax=Gouania willdenowi TaxID=441366 RepID=A0A8C5DFS8_GOUWI